MSPAPDAQREFRRITEKHARLNDNYPPEICSECLGVWPCPTELDRLELARLQTLEAEARRALERLQRTPERMRDINLDLGIEILSAALGEEIE